VSLLVDVFGYLSIILHGLTIVGQSVAVGSVLFLTLLARPLCPRLGAVGPAIEHDTLRIAFWAAVGLAAAELLALALQLAVLSGTLQLPIAALIGAQSSVAALIKLGATVALAMLLRSGRRPMAAVLLLLCLAELSAATLTTHAAARLDHRPLLLVLEWLHQLGAAIWIGGLPCFVAALARGLDGAAWRLIGARFSRMSIAGVACIVVSGGAMCLFYIGAWVGFYGTAYGIMVGAKIAMLCMLLLLGAGNFLLVERLRAHPATNINQMRRFAEVEIGIGFTVFFAAASLTSVPPAIDQLQDRVTWHEIVARNTPQWPRMRSPDHDILALPALQAELDRDATVRAAQPAAAFTPGSGLLPPRNAADIAWSEYNHHWAGTFVLLAGLLALLHQLGVRWARHWPLIFLGLAVFLFLRSDPEVWPLGVEGFFSSLRDVEVFQHRIFVMLTVLFAVFEWRVRAGGLAGTKAAYVFPLLTAAGGALLLTHSHAIANIHDQVLIELTHTPLALLGIAAGWARWLELRLQPPISRWAALVWPVCLILAALLLLLYREA
jgi:putative copper resistance protein D